MGHHITLPKEYANPQVQRRYASSNEKRNCTECLPAGWKQMSFTEAYRFMQLRAAVTQGTSGAVNIYNASCMPLMAKYLATWGAKPVWHRLDACWQRTFIANTLVRLPNHLQTNTAEQNIKRHVKNYLEWKH